MRAILLSGIVPLVWLTTALRPSLVPNRSEVTAQHVRESIEHAANFLKSQQQADGTWPNRPGYAGGLTPLCTLALLNSGCGLDDEVLRKSLTYLRTFKPEATYTASLQTMVFCAAEPKRDLNLILRNVKWLEGRQVKEGASSGMWARPVAGTPDHTDNSMTHLAILALYEAERAGVGVNEKTWRLALDYWTRSQNPDGSWGWGPGYPGTGSMTCAGIAAVIIASGRLGRPDAVVEGDRVDCCHQGQPNRHVERAVGWMERNFSVSRNPGMKFWLSYYLYSLERAGRMTARRFFGTHDWYREAAAMLVKTQLHSGEWPSDMDNEYQGDRNVSTSFALMCLAKARRPVLLARLKHEPADDWNRHPGALFNLVSHVEASWQRDVTHQVIDIAAASVEDLLEAPVIYLSGRDAPRLGVDERRKLRMYVDRGGFLFFQQCCGGTFDAGLRKMLGQMFPEPGAALHLLPADHPAWHAEERVDPDYLPELWGIDVGCRTGVIYSPGDLSCCWELDRMGRGGNYSQQVQQRLRAARAIGINVLAYATNRDVNFKDPAMARPDVAEHKQAFERNTLYVANVLHPGGCDAAPSAAGRLLRLVAEKLEVRVSTEPRSVRLTDPELYRYHLVWLHGRRSFELTPEERACLRTYLERGGMVLADSICSSKEFGDSLVREMQLIFPHRPMERIAADDPLFGSEFGGERVTTVSRRQSDKSAGAALVTTVREQDPYLEGLRLGNRYAVIFSPYDISCALEGRGTLGCEGYTPESAAHIATNVLLYSLHE